MSTTENFFGFEQISVNDKVETILIFEEITKELEEYLLEKSIDTNSTDSVFDFPELLTNRVQEDFDELIGEDTNKKVLSKVWHIYSRCYLTQKSTLPTRSKKYSKLPLKWRWKYGKNKSNCPTVDCWHNWNGDW